MRWLMPTAQYFMDREAPKLQFIPILIAGDGSYPIEPNTYLVERSCGEWGDRRGQRSDRPDLKKSTIDGLQALRLSTLL